jgi:hypothetical protein
MTVSTTLTILFSIGGGVNTVAGLVVLVGVYLYLIHHRLSAAFLIMLSFMLLGLVYFLMLLDWWPKQRHDGVEFPWYRDVAQIVITFFQTIIVAKELGIDGGLSGGPLQMRRYLDIPFDCLVIVSVNTIAFVSLTFANFATPEKQWWFWGAGVALLLGCAVVWTYLRTRMRTLPAIMAQAASLVWLLGLPVVQALSWTMTEVLDTSPRRKSSEIAYLIVSFAGLLIPLLVIVYTTFVTEAYLHRDAHHKHQ